MLGFWPSDAALIATQASLVCGPQPKLPRMFTPMRSGVWAWLVMPVSLGGTILVLALVPGLGTAYAWVAAIGVPLLAMIAFSSVLGRRLNHVGAASLSAVVLVGALLALAWRDDAGLPGQAAAVLLTAVSACTLASYLAALTSASVMRVALVAMATLDAILVFGQLLQGPNQTLNAAGVAASVPHLQYALFGSVVVGYGDLFVSAVLGNILATPQSPVSRWQAAVLVLICSALFDLLFLCLNALPATVPVAIALLLIEAKRRRVRRRVPFRVAAANVDPNASSERHLPP